MARKKDVPFLKGKIEIWAAAVIHALGSINELQYERQQILDKEEVKIRILSILKTDRSLTNKEIRQLTEMNQKQVQRLIKELELDGVKIVGKGARTKYIYSP